MHINDLLFHFLMSVQILSLYLTKNTFGFHSRNPQIPIDPLAYLENSQIYIQKFIYSTLGPFSSLNISLLLQALVKDLEKSMGLYIKVSCSCPVSKFILKLYLILQPPTMICNPFSTFLYITHLTFNHSPLYFCYSLSKIWFWGMRGNREF